MLVFCPSLLKMASDSRAIICARGSGILATASSSSPTLTSTPRSSAWNASRMGCNKTFSLGVITKTVLVGIVSQSAFSNVKGSIHQG